MGAFCALSRVCIGALSTCCSLPPTHSVALQPTEGSKVHHARLGAITGLRNSLAERAARAGTVPNRMCWNWVGECGSFSRLLTRSREQETEGEGDGREGEKGGD